MVTPSSRDSSTSSCQKPSRATGSTPEVGSSRIRISGLVDYRHGQRQALAHAQRQAFGQAVQPRRPARSVRALPDARSRSAAGIWNSRACRSRFCRTSARRTARRPGTCSRPAGGCSGRAGSTVLPNSSASPSLAGSRPVSIFMVVSCRSRWSRGNRRSRPRAMRKRHRVHRDEVAEAHGQALGLDGRSVAVRARGGSPPARWPRRFSSGSRADEGLLQAGACRCAPAARRGCRWPVRARRPSPPGGRSARLPPCRRWRPARSSAGAAARMRAISSQNWLRDSGSTPVVGSSRISRSGSWISAQHRPELLLHAAGQLARRAFAERPTCRCCAAGRRSGARVRRRPGRTGGRRTRGSRTRTASG